jgi:hypothetical protein
VGFAVEDPVALFDRGPADGLCQMALAGAGWAEEEGVLVPVDEGPGGEVEDETPVHLLVEGEVDVVERLLGIAEPGLFGPAFEKTQSSAVEFVVDQAGDQIDRRRHAFGLGLMEPGFQSPSEAAQAELAQGALEFGDVHDGCCSRSLSWMRSRYWVSSRMSGST